MKLSHQANHQVMFAPAAFRRLCVETSVSMQLLLFRQGQPPSGGCVLKLSHSRLSVSVNAQPPSGGCVLKPSGFRSGIPSGSQPPSGGCVLKQQAAAFVTVAALPAAFRRLCVETARPGIATARIRPQPPSGGCVLKHQSSHDARWRISPSRLQAAVC